VELCYKPVAMMRVRRCRSCVVGRHPKDVSCCHAVVAVEEGCYQLSISHKVIQKLCAICLTRSEYAGVPGAKQFNKQLANSCSVG
jgi:hypothetical protein